jgi:transketolase
MALAGRIQKQDYRVLVVLSDGECNEGSTWEAALYAPAQQLENLVVVVDFNKWQATGRSEEVTHLTPLRDKWTAFGWHTAEINGNDMAEVVAALDDAFANTGKPTAIVAHTIKGRGVSFMEDDNNWHYRIPTAEEVQAAHMELGL